MPYQAHPHHKPHGKNQRNLLGGQPGYSQGPLRPGMYFDVDPSLGVGKAQDLGPAAGHVAWTTRTSNFWKDHVSKERDNVPAGEKRGVSDTWYPHYPDGMRRNYSEGVSGVLKPGGGRSQATDQHYTSEYKRRYDDPSARAFWFPSSERAIPKKGGKPARPQSANTYKQHMKTLQKQFYTTTPGHINPDVQPRHEHNRNKVLDKARKEELKDTLSAVKKKMYLLGKLAARIEKQIGTGVGGISSRKKNRVAAVYDDTGKMMDW